MLSIKPGQGMAVYALNVCRRCANVLLADSPASLSRDLIRRTPRLSKRGISVFPFTRKQTLYLSAPDPLAEPSSSPPPIKRDPGLTLREHGIPVPPSPNSRKDFTDEKSWAETVLRTLSGGMKSDYLKCTELDEHGNVRVGMQAFKKVELCTMVSPSSNETKDI